MGFVRLLNHNKRIFLTHLKLTNMATLTNHSQIVEKVYRDPKIQTWKKGRRFDEKKKQKQEITFTTRIV